MSSVRSLLYDTILYEMFIVRWLLAWPYNTKQKLNEYKN